MATIDRRAHARQAIQQLAADNNLPSELTILSERWNTIARLGDSDVIAKAATLAHLTRHDPQHWFDQEVRVSAELAVAGAPVQTPWAGALSAQSSSGIPISFWQRIDGEVAGSSLTELVDSLAELHRLGEGIILHQPWFATITSEVPATLSILGDRGVLDSASVRMLGDRLLRLLDDLDSANLPEGFVHGDAQRKNAMQTCLGPIWIDLEEVCRGPLVWDIACLTMNAVCDAEQLLDRYALVSGSDRIGFYHFTVLRQLREMEGLVWMLAIQEEREPAFREEASAQLARMLRVATSD